MGSYISSLLLLQKYHSVLIGILRAVAVIQPFKSFQLLRIADLIFRHKPHHLSPGHFAQGSLFDDFSVIYSTDANDINEIGIFHCEDEISAKEFFTVLKGYVSDQQENQKAFIASYAPREVPKLDVAEARRYGNYVIYTILDQNAKNEVFDEAKELLRE